MFPFFWNFLMTFIFHTLCWALSGHLSMETHSFLFGNFSWIIFYSKTLSIFLVFFFWIAYYSDIDILSRSSSFPIFSVVSIPLSFQRSYVAISSVSKAPDFCWICQVGECRDVTSSILHMFWGMFLTFFFELPLYCFYFYYFKN